MDYGQSIHTKNFSQVSKGPEFLLPVVSFEVLKKCLEDFMNLDGEFVGR